MKDVIKTMRQAFHMTKQRCYNPNCPDYPYYGGRGIRICDRWLQSFDNFLEDMGLRPDGMTLERLDVNGPYCKENCVWASRKEQTSNRRETLKLTYKGETKTLAEWAEVTGIGYYTLKARKTRLGYSDEECIEKNTKPGEKLPGKTYKARRPQRPDTFRRGFASKLSTPRETVEAAQAYYDTGGKTYTDVAKKFNLAIETASRICQREGYFKL